MTKQNSEVRFKCKTEEHNLIKKKAKEVGMSMKQFILYISKNATLKIKVE